MSAPGRRVEVEIDELVLHGFEASQRDRIAEAVRSELVASLDGWVPQEGGEIAVREGGSFSVPPAASPAVIGRGVARHINQILRDDRPTATSQGGKN